MGPFVVARNVNDATTNTPAFFVQYRCANGLSGRKCLGDPPNSQEVGLSENRRPLNPLIQQDFPY